MRHTLLHTLGNAVWAARSRRRASRPLLAAYMRLKLEELAASRRAATGGVRRTEVLGWEVRFFDHYWLVEMFEEIFLRDQYYFESDASAPLVVDVGSNIGLSILYFKRLFPAARIVGFEPDPETFQVLSENVIGNGLADVLLLNQAVYDGVESVVLYGDPATPACPQQSTRRLRLDGSEVRVAASRLSEHLAEPVDYLKLDVEGAEGVVLTELDESGKLALVRKMTVECHHHLDGVEDSLAGMLSTLERNGFGYQLEARSGPREDGVYQNVLVHAYSKNVDG